ncbi:MAG TPA: T9SS type A sorting domain-containing protein, partial [Bacteroidetes bacterium]|nr:T9SS type A sorting domain-containing protein [Bacteroidota bacterium]
TTYGHSGHAFIKHYSVPFECKMKIKLVDSDLLLHKMYHKCNKLSYEEDENGLCKNPTLLFGGLEPRHRSEVEEYAGVDYTELWACPGPGGQRDDERDRDLYKELIPEFDFVVYPTISPDNITLEFYFNQYSKYELSIYTLVGDVIVNEELDSVSNKKEIDISNFNQGIYFISLSSKNSGNKKVLKFVKP